MIFCKKWALPKVQVTHEGVSILSHVACLISSHKKTWWWQKGHTTTITPVVSIAEAPAQKKAFFQVLWQYMRIEYILPFCSHAIKTEAK